jgi:ribosome-associated protein
MANEIVTQEFNKIFKNDKFEYPLNLAMGCAYIAANYKGFNLKMYDFEQTSSLCDFAILVSANNPNQAKTMIDEILYNAKRNGSEMVSLEGLEEMNWVLLDLGDVIVHVFMESAREIYDLDTLWVKRKQVKIPDEYYYSTTDVKPKKEDPTENYF